MIQMSIGNDAAEKEPTNESAQELIHFIQTYMPPAEVEQVFKALQLAQETCAGIRGLRLIPPLEHALAIANILAQLHIDAIGVSSGLIFEAVDAELVSLERVEGELGMAVGRVMDSMLRMNILERKKQSMSQGQVIQAEAEKNNDPKKQRIRETMRRQQAETVRKMFFAMSEDPRVVLLKLAYRLHAMRVSHYKTYTVDLQDMQTMALETLEIYAPLAGRLGMSRLESELEDIAFAVLEPEKYAWLQSVLEEERKQWRQYVDQVCGVLREEMAKLGLDTEVSGRVKHLYSFYKKLKRTAGDNGRIESLQKVDLNQIHDLIAFRILVHSTSDCYLALGHVHSLWKPKEGRIKDFIANSKPNGYQALHTTVFCLEDQLVEIQIRTFAMHETAEYGVAMHWHYKDVGDRASGEAKELLSWLHQLAEWQRELRASTSSDAEFVKAVRDEFLEEQIFVFTPKGEVKDLPVGSTPLDFAYRIHTKVGDHCAGARVTTESGSGDGEHLITRMVPLDYELQSGDIVDIITTRTAHPTRDWLNFARTAATKSKIRRYLKTYERDINIQIGRERLERELKNLERDQKGMRDLEDVGEDAQNALCNMFHRDAFADILAAIGSDELRPHAVAMKIQEIWGTEIKEEERPLPTIARTSKAAQLQVGGVSGLLTNLANCCCPLPGDEIVGFISRGKGAIVHRADCNNIQRYRERERERLVNVNWTIMAQSRYMAPIIITARDRPGLIRDIAAAVSDPGGVNMVAVRSHTSPNREQAVIAATLEIEHLEQLERLFAKLAKIKGVIGIERDLGKKH